MTFASQDFRVRDADENLKESQAEYGIPQFTVPAGEATSTTDDPVMAVRIAFETTLETVPFDL